MKHATSILALSRQDLNHCSHSVVLSFKSMDEILQCDQRSESYLTILSCSTVYYAVQGGSDF